jgi:hypothetical protein
MAAAISAVGDAVRTAREIEDSALSRTITKLDASPVTMADFAVQAVVAARLAQAFSADPLVAEEDATALRTASGQLLLDDVVDAVRRSIPDARPEGALGWIDRGRGHPGRRFWTLGSRLGIGTSVAKRSPWSRSTRASPIRRARSSQAWSPAHPRSSPPTAPTGSCPAGRSSRWLSRHPMRRRPRHPPHRVSPSWLACETGEAP